MRTARVLTASAICLLLSPATFAEDVTLPAPVLEWAVYIVLIFAVCVAIGISIFMRGKNASDDSLGNLLDERNPIIHSVHPDISVTECIGRMNELRISDFQTLFEVAQKYRSGLWVFRGISNLNFDLIPKIGRPPIETENEKWLFDFFVRESVSYLDTKPISELEFLALAQRATDESPSNNSPGTLADDSGQGLLF